jgi:hypothetical protein
MGEVFSPCWLDQVVNYMRGMLHVALWHVLVQHVHI